MSMPYYPYKIYIRYHHGSSYTETYVLLNAPDESGYAESDPPAKALPSAYKDAYFDDTGSRNEMGIGVNYNGSLFSWTEWSEINLSTLTGYLDLYPED
jgi:hypothetical protein